MGKKDILDTAKWSALTWAFVAGALGSVGAYVPGGKVPAATAGLALVVATVLPEIAERWWKKRLPASGEGGSGAAPAEGAAAPHPFEQRLIEEAKAHREWLHTSLQTVSWACGIVLTAGLGVALWVLGDSAHAAAANATERKLSEADWSAKLQTAIDESLAGVPNTVRKAVEDAAGTSAQQAVDAAVGRKLEQTSNATVRELVVAYLDRVAPALTPIGSVVAWPSTLPKPEGWEFCEGGQIPATDADRIWQVLGETYGKADPGKVRLPQFSGYFLRGAGNGALEIGKPQESASAVPFLGAPEGNLMLVGVEKADSQEKQDSYVRSAIVRSTEKRDEGAETRPKNYAVHWIIRVR